MSQTLSDACVALGELSGEQARLERELDSARDLVQAAREDYEAAWTQELQARCEETGLSWCTYCGQVCAADTLADGFTTDWHTDGYDPVPDWRYTEWYRTCPDCFAKKAFKPRPASEYPAAIEFGQSRGQAKPFWVRDHRQQSRPHPDESLDELTERLGLPPRWSVLQQSQGAAAWQAALVVKPTPPGVRARTSPLAERSN